jgi:hypothetical protein
MIGQGSENKTQIHLFQIHSTTYDAVSGRCNHQIRKFLSREVQLNRLRKFNVELKRRNRSITFVKKGRIKVEFIILGIRRRGVWQGRIEWCFTPLYFGIRLDAKIKRICETNGRDTRIWSTNRFPEVNEFSHQDLN